jgi:hypothetical protein
MKIYLLSQEQNQRYDSYDSVVVVAKDEESARLIQPTGNDTWDDEDYHSIWWCKSPEDVKVEFIGTYKGKEKLPHVILASYNAG